MEYWKVGNSVESHSYPHEVPGGERITKEGYDAFIASMPLPEPPGPGLAERVDALESKMSALEMKT